MLQPLSTTTIGTIGTSGSSGASTFSSWDTGDSRAYPTTVTLELIDGSVALLDLSYQRTTNMIEKSIKFYKVDWHFPFIHKCTKRYTEFTYKNFGSNDIIYQVNCSMTALLQVMNIKYKSFDEIKLLDIVKNGSQDN